MQVTDTTGNVEAEFDRRRQQCRNHHDEQHECEQQAVRGQRRRRRLDHECRRGEYGRYSDVSTSESACNQVSISTDPHDVNVNSQQDCNATDPYSQLNASVANSGNGVALTSLSTGNAFEEDTNAPNSTVKNYQTNNSTEDSAINAAIANTTGNVTVTSVAIGNNAEIVHY